MSADKKAMNYEERVQYWREVMSRASQYAGSDYAFCLSEGISKSPFYNWKKKLSKIESLSRSVSTGSFSEVQVSGSKINSEFKLSPRGLIDARWVADLILHLHGGLR